MLLSAIYWNHHSTGVFVDAVIEIGQCGLHRKFAIASIDDGHIDNMFYKYLERGETLMDNLEIKFKFNRKETPRLIRTIPKTQAVSYTQMISLTVEGDNESSALAYLENIIDNIIERHDRIFNSRKRYAAEYIAGLQAIQAEQDASCTNLAKGSQLYSKTVSESGQEQTCDVNRSVDLILLRAKINHLMSPSNCFASSVALAPTAR